MKRSLKKRFFRDNSYYEGIAIMSEKSDNVKLTVSQKSSDSLESKMISHLIKNFERTPFRLVGIKALHCEQVYWISHDRLYHIPYWKTVFDVSPPILDKEDVDVIEIDTSDEVLLQLLSFIFNPTHVLFSRTYLKGWRSAMELFMLCFKWEYHEGIEHGIKYLEKIEKPTLIMIRLLPDVIKKHYPKTYSVFMSKHKKAVLDNQIEVKYTLDSVGGNVDLLVDLLNLFAGKAYSTTNNKKIKITYEKRDMKIGRYIVVLDTINKKYLSKILDTRKTSDGEIELHIKYIGWTEKWDEWIKINSKRISRKIEPEIETYLKKVPVCEKCGDIHKQVSERGIFESERSIIHIKK